MADAADVQSLFLQVDASVELLRRNLASAEQPLGQFEQRAAKTAMSVEKSIGTMGKNFGPFAQLAQNAAQQAEKSFNDSFSNIQKMAAKAIEAPTVKGGGLNLGAAEARQAAETARQQAAALGLIERAAQAAAAGEGVLTQETRLYLQAASAARIEAERHAAELVREAGALERLEIETRAAAAGHQVLIAGQRGVITASAQQRQSTMMLGQQTQDFFVQVMSGQSVTTAFVQQIGQAAFAVQGMGGRMEKVGAFLMSGWGSAVLVATTILVPLVAKVLDQNNALDDAVDKLEKEAKETAVSDKAHAIFSRTLEGQIALQRQLNDELDRSVRTQRQDQQLTLYRNVASLRGLRAGVPGQEAAIADQQKLVNRYNAQIADPTRYGIEPDAMLGLVAAAGQADQKLRDMRDKLVETRKSITDAERTVREAKMPLIQSDIEAGLDKRTAAVNRYNEALGRLQRQFAIGEGNSGRMFLDEKTSTGFGPMVQGIGQAQFNREAARLKREYDAALKAEQERQAAQRRADSSARNGNLTPGAVGSMLTGQFGGTVTSTTGGKHVPNSYHYRSQAVDFVPRGGMGSVGKDEIRAYLESQGVNIKELLGPGDKNHNDHFHVAFGKTARSGEEIARRTEAAQNAILSDQISFAEQSRQARRRLLDAQGRSATTEEERDRLAREEIAADYEAQRTKIAAQTARKDLKPTEAADLNRLNEQTRDQRLQNVAAERAMAKIAAGYDASAQSADAQMAMLRIQGDMALTLGERRRIALELLRLEQEQYQRALERTRDTSQDPNEVQRAKDALGALPAQQAAERAQAEQRYSGPMGQYVDNLRSTVGDTGEALEGAAARGFGALEDSAARAATKLMGVRGVLGGIVGDLIQIATRKLILSAIGSSTGLGFLGLSGGGKVEGRAGGGKVSGPGSGTSDSILAMLGAKPIMLSNGESIVTAEATAKFWPVIDAMNKGKVKQLASGGMVSGLPSLPSIVAPRLPAMSRYGQYASQPRESLSLKVEPSPYFTVEVQRIAAPMAQASVVGGASMALDEMAERNAQTLS